jgi:hypothetical protein
MTGLDIGEELTVARELVSALQLMGRGDDLIDSAAVFRVALIAGEALDAIARKLKAAGAGVTP